MKKVFIIAVIALFYPSYAISGQTYSSENTKECGELICDLAGQPITGKIVAKYPDGKLWAEGNFQNGMLEGLTKTYYINGNFEFEENYKSGKLEGLKRIYYINGNLAAEVNYKNGQEEGLAKNYYINGNLWSEVNYKNGEEEGLIKAYDMNGNLGAEINFKDGKAVSGYLYENGKKREMTNAHLHNMNKMFETALSRQNGQE